MEHSDISREQIEFAGLQRVNYSKLPWEEKMTIIWGWFWRMFMVTLGTGAVAGFVLTIFIAILVTATNGLDPSVYSLILFILGAVLGIFTTHPLISWILSSRIGGYRIVLCRKRVDDQIELESPSDIRKVAF
jgi:Sec-independent protein secretion pathway component TatC